MKFQKVLVENWLLNANILCKSQVKWYLFKMVLQNDFAGYGQSFDHCPKVRAANPAFHYRSTSVCSEDSIHSSYYSDNNIEPHNFSVSPPPVHSPSDSELNLGRYPKLGSFCISLETLKLDQYYFHKIIFLLIYLEPSTNQFGFILDLFTDLSFTLKHLSHPLILVDAPI